MESFLRVHGSKIKGILSGFDRVRFRGSLRMLANTKGLFRMLSYLSVLLKDFGDWSQDLTERIRRATAELAGKRQRPVIYLSSCHTDKEAFARNIAQQDGITEGLICVLTCVESCNTFTIHKNARTKKLELQPFQGRCLHQYFYIQHPVFGFMHMRLQTWVPFTLHVNINGREWLSNQMRQAGIAYEKRDNCFSDVEDFARAQALLTEQLSTPWEQVFGDLVREYHPMHAALPIFERQPYYWSVDEMEWATDVAFHSVADLARLYPGFVRHAVTQMGCQDVLRYLGRCEHVAQYRNGQITTSVLTRREGTRCKHTIDGNSTKMYDKHGNPLRFETTTTNPRGMKAFRPKEGDPEGERKWRPLRKGIADLHRRAELSQKSNERYLEALASVEHPETLGMALAQPCRPTTHRGRRIRALNPFQADDARLLAAVNQGKFLIHGFRNRDLKQELFGDKTRESKTKTGRSQSARVTRLLTLLRAHHLIRKVPRSHRYMITNKGRSIITTILAAQHANPKQLTELAV